MHHEIKMQLLQMAYEIHSDDYNSRREVILNHWDNIVGKANQGCTKLPPLPKLPQYVTPEQIIATASILAQFVLGNKNNIY